MKKLGKKLVSSLAFALLLFGSFTGVAFAGWENATVSHNCNATVPGIFNLNFSISTEIDAFVPDSVQPAEHYNITNFSASISIPQSVVDTLKKFGWTNVIGTVSLFEVESDNIPQVINAADPSIAIPSTPVPSNSGLVLKVPASGTLTVGPFEAGESGIIKLSVRNIKFQLRNPSLGYLSPVLNAECTPSGDTTFAQIPINP